MTCLTRMRLIPVIILGLIGGLTIGPARAQVVCTWNGSVSTDWGTAVNWTPAAVPTANDHVVLNANARPPALATSLTIQELTMNADARLAIGTFTLTVTGRALFYDRTRINDGLALGGQLTTGSAATPAPRVLFGGASSDRSVFNTAVSVWASDLNYAGSTFNGVTRFTHAGGGDHWASGGNLFRQAVYLTRQGSGAVRTTMEESDVFEQDVYLTDEGTIGGEAGFLGIAFNTWSSPRPNADFRGNVYVRCLNNPSGYIRIIFNGRALLAGKVIAPWVGFDSGALELELYRPTGSALQTIALTGAQSSLELVNCTLDAPLALTAPLVRVERCVFNAELTLTHAGNTMADWMQHTYLVGSGDGNVFAGRTTLVRNGAGGLFTIGKNTFRGELVLRNAAGDDDLGNGITLSGGNGDLTELEGSLTLENTHPQGLITLGGRGTARVTLRHDRALSATAGMFETGRLTLNQLEQLANPAGSVYATSALSLGRAALVDIRGSRLRGEVNATAGGIAVEGTTFEGVCRLRKTGNGTESSGNNVFRQATTLVREAGALGRWWWGWSQGDVFEGDLTLENNERSGTNNGNDDGLHVASRAVTQPTRFVGNVTFRSSFTGDDRRGGIISLGLQGGVSVLSLAAGKSLDATGFQNGRLHLENVRQDNTSPVMLELPATAQLRLWRNRFLGNVSVRTGGLNWSGNEFLGTTTTVEQNGSLPFLGSDSYGGNRFTGATQLICSNPIGLVMGLDAASPPDVFEGELTLTNQAQGGGIRLAEESRGTQVKGNVRFVNNNPGDGQVSLGANGGTWQLSGGLLAAPGAFKAGTLQLLGLRQVGTQPLSLDLSSGGGTAVLDIGTLSASAPEDQRTNFTGPTSFTAPVLVVNGARFGQEATLVQTGNEATYWRGGNVFTRKVTLRATGTGLIKLANAPTTNQVVR